MHITAGFEMAEDVDVSGGNHEMTNFPGHSCSGIYVGVSGDVSVDTYAPDGTVATIVYVGLAAGVMHSLPCLRVNQAGTDATDIVAGSW